MSASLKVISNTTKHSGVISLSSFQTETDLPLLGEYGIRCGGIAAMRAPYEMRRVGGSESRHVCLWLIREGSVRFQQPDRTLIAGPGSTLIMTPDFDRICTVESGVFRHIYFILSPWMGVSCGVYESAHAEEMESLLKMVFRELTEPETYHRRICLEHFASLLGEYVGREMRRDSCDLRLRQMFELLETEMTCPWTTASLARRLGVSASLLYQLCRRQYGRSPGELTAEVKFRFASELLRVTGDKLDALAGAIGYSNAFAFSKAFFKHTGRRPTQLRRK